MATTAPAPPGASFAFDMAIRALDEQLRRIDSLDSKAGVLIAADGVLAGLLLGTSSLARIPRFGASVVLALLLSLILALLAFLNRRYDFAPTPEAVVRFARVRDDRLRWFALGSVMEALETNRRKLARKAGLFTGGLVLLIVAVVAAGGYSLWELGIWR